MSGGLTMTATVNKSSFKRLQVLTEDMNERAVKAFGTIYVRQMAASTPPHPWGTGPAALSSKGHEDIKSLHRRIAQDIAGVDSPAQVQAFAYPVPSKKWPGSWMAIDTATKRPAKPRGNFGIVVPTSWARVRKQVVPESTPEAAFEGARWQRGHKKPAGRARRHFVRRAKLAAFIRKQQKHAGKLISGWAPAARVFATGKNIAPGFFEHHGGKGFGRIYKNKGEPMEGIATNRMPYSALQGADIKKRIPRVLKNARGACQVQMENIRKWYQRQAKKSLKKP